MKKIYLLILCLASLIACSTREQNTPPPLDNLDRQEYYAELERQGDLKLAEHDAFCETHRQAQKCQPVIAPGMEWLND